MENSFQILPPRKDACPICAATHEPMLPHNRSSMYYQMKFHQEYGRFPTWEDAMAHCNDEMKDLWREELRKHGLLPGEVKKDEPEMGAI